MSQSKTPLAFSTKPTLAEKKYFVHLPLVPEYARSVPDILNVHTK